MKMNNPNDPNLVEPPQLLSGKDLIFIDMVVGMLIGILLTLLGGTFKLWGALICCVSCAVALGLLIMLTRKP